MAVTQILTIEQAAQQLGRSPDTLRYWRQRGEGPASFRLGRRVAYAQADIDAFVERERAATLVGGAVPA